jgi:hypothetical protein
MIIFAKTAVMVNPIIYRQYSRVIRVQVARNLDRLLAEDGIVMLPIDKEAERRRKRDRGQYRSEQPNGASSGDWHWSAFLGYTGNSNPEYARTWRFLQDWPRARSDS